MLIELIIFIGKIIKLLTVVFEDHNIILVSHMWHLFEHLVRVFSFIFNHLVVALIQEFLETRDLKDVFGVRLESLVRVTCDSQQVSFQSSFCAI